MNNKEMKYKVLPNANVLMSTDGTKQLFIKVGSDVIPAGLPRASMKINSFFEETILSDEEAALVETLAESKTPIIARLVMDDGFVFTTTLSHFGEADAIGAYSGVIFMGMALNVMLVPGDIPETLGKWVLLFIPMDTNNEEDIAEEPAAE